MAKRPVPLYDFKAFGAAIKAARNEYGESRKKVSDELYISPRYLANIENKGQQPSLQVFYDLVTRYHISVDQFFFPNSNAEKSTGRRQLDALLDGMSDKGISLFNCVGFSNVGFSCVGFSNVGLSNVGFSNDTRSRVGGCPPLVAASALAAAAARI